MNNPSATVFAQFSQPCPCNSSTFDVFVFVFAVVFFGSFCFNVFIRFLNNSSATVFAQSSQPCPRSSSAVFVSLFMYLYLYLYLCLYSMFAQCAQACPYSSCSCSGLKTTAVSVLQMYKISIVTIYKIHRQQYSSIYCDNDNCWWSQQSRADVEFCFMSRPSLSDQCHFSASASKVNQ